MQTENVFVCDVEVRIDGDRRHRRKGLWILCLTGIEAGSCLIVLSGLLFSDLGTSLDEETTIFGFLFIGQTGWFEAVDTLHSQ